MAELSKQAMEEIQNLAVNGGESGISLSKVQTTPEVGNLVISLGGSGADMLRETKGLINQNCSSDKDKHVAPNRVAYLAFDTAKNEKEKKSSKATGQITLDDNELIILPDGGLSILLDPAIRNDNRARYPYIYRWLDTRIPPLSGQNGAGGIRQAGRAMLFLEMNNVVEAIRRTISKLITGNEVKSLNIYLLAGISGGTGNNVQLIQVGYPMRSFYLYQQVYDKQGNPINGVYVDRAGAKDENNKVIPDGKITADDKFLTHHADPDVTIGFNTSFTWKNWTAALSGHASIGNWVYNNVASDTEMLADLWTNSFVGNRVSSATKSMFTQAQYLSDYYLQNGSFLKLDNFTLGYTFPQFHVDENRTAVLNIFGTVQNIVTITGYKGVDPEVYGGIDNNMYPRPRTFILGVKFNF